MPLGTYYVPYTNSILDKKSERNDKDEKGLQEDFSKAVKDAVNEANEKGFNITLGTYGYMSTDAMQRMARNGKPQYKKKHEYFRWGLAWEVSKISYSDGNKEKDFVEYRENDIVAAGLNLVKISVTTKGKGATVNGKQTTVAYIFIPTGFKQDETIEKVKYDSTTIDKDTQEASAASADGTDGFDSDGGSSASFAEGAYFFTNMFQNIQDQALGELLKGDRALANDEALWGSVQSAIHTSMRSCMSAPDGSFIAWYPDYWGLVDSTPNLILEDIELIDLTITHSDASFYSHVFTPGVSASGQGIDAMLTQGVVSVESGMAAATSETIFNEEGVSIASTEPSALLSKMIYIPEGEGWKYSPAELYRRYGARPKKTDDTFFAGTTKLIEAEEGDEGSGNEFDKSYDSNPKYILPFLNALYEFMYHWSQQYSANLQITFMPELFPGMRIKVKSLDISFYVKSVSHSMDYTSGFTTTVEAICPVGSLLPGMVNPDKSVSGNKSTSSGSTKEEPKFNLYVQG